MNDEVLAIDAAYTYAYRRYCGESESKKILLLLLCLGSMRHIRSQIKFEDPSFPRRDLLVILLLDAGYFESMVFVELAGAVVVYLDVEVH